MNTDQCIKALSNLLTAAEGEESKTLVHAIKANHILRCRGQDPVGFRTMILNVPNQVQVWVREQDNKILSQHIEVGCYLAKRVLRKEGTPWKEPSANS